MDELIPEIAQEIEQERRVVRRQRDRELADDIFHLTPSQGVVANFLLIYADLQHTPESLSSLTGLGAEYIKYLLNDLVAEGILTKSEEEESISETTYRLRDEAKLRRALTYG